jgi:hypothetical protein
VEWRKPPEWRKPLEVRHLSADQLASADAVLGSMHLASSSRRMAEADTIIADPTGYLRSLQDQVSHRFPGPSGSDGAASKRLRRSPTISAQSM